MRKRLAAMLGTSIRYKNACSDGAIGSQKICPTIGILLLLRNTSTKNGVCLGDRIYNNNNNNNNNGRNGSFLRGWLPHRGKAQLACNYCFPTRTMFSINSEF